MAPSQKRGTKAAALLSRISHSMTRNGEPTASIHEGIVKHDPTAEILIVVKRSELFCACRGLEFEYRDDDQNAGPEQRW